MVLLWLLKWLAFDTSSEKFGFFPFEGYLKTWLLDVLWLAPKQRLESFEEGAIASETSNTVLVSFATLSQDSRKLVIWKHKRATHTFIGSPLDMEDCSPPESRLSTLDPSEKMCLERLHYLHLEMEEIIWISHFLNLANNVPWKRITGKKYQPSLIAPSDERPAKALLHLNAGSFIHLLNSSRYWCSNSASWLSDCKFIRSSLHGEHQATNSFNGLLKEVKLLKMTKLFYAPSAVEVDASIPSWISFNLTMQMGNFTHKHSK